MKLSEYLCVFNHAISHGEKHEGKYLLGDISVFHDFDGYTCFIVYKDLTMSMYFHSRFEFYYKVDQTLDDFHKLISELFVNINK